MGCRETKEELLQLLSDHQIVMTDEEFDSFINSIPKLSEEELTDASLEEVAGGVRSPYPIIKALKGICPFCGKRIGFTGFGLHFCSKLGRLGGIKF